MFNKTEKQKIIEEQEEKEKTFYKYPYCLLKDRIDYKKNNKFYRNFYCDYILDKRLYDYNYKNFAKNAFTGEMFKTNQVEEKCEGVNNTIKNPSSENYLKPGEELLLIEIPNENVEQIIKKTAVVSSTPGYVRVENESNEISHKDLHKRFYVVKNEPYNCNSFKRHIYAGRKTKRRSKRRKNRRSRKI